MNEISRRKFLFRAGTVTAGTGVLAGCQDPPGPYALERPEVPGDDQWPLVPERWVATTCGQCDAGCGIRVRVVNARAVKIEGHPDNPVNGGGVGPKGQAGLHVLYHPDRVRQPLRREGDRGAGHWQPISWQEAISEIGEKLRQLRTAGDPRGLVVLDGQRRGVMPRLWDRFLTAFGSPNHIGRPAARFLGASLAMQYMQGTAEVPAYDLSRASLILGFGENLLESNSQLIHAIQAATTGRDAEEKRACRFVQVSTNYTLSASKADQWVAVRPGSEGALALGLAHVLVRDALYDKTFVAEHTFGFHAWEDEQGSHPGFGDDVVQDYPPEKVGAITGVAPEAIESLAHMLVTERPAVVLDDVGPGTNVVGTALAIHALNALLGNLQQPGGVFVPERGLMSEWEPVPADSVAQRSLLGPRIDRAEPSRWPLTRHTMLDLPELILSKKPYPVEALLLYYSNPVYSQPEGARWVKALKQIPLVVSFSPLPDESTLWADYVLPDHTYLERWELVEPAPHDGPPTLGLRQPVVVPRHNTMSTGDLLLQLSRSLGSPMSEALAWEDYKAAQYQLLEAAQQVSEASLSAQNPRDLAAKMEAAGSWSGPAAWEGDWKRAFATKSGKFEFYSQAMAAQLTGAFPDNASLEEYLHQQGVISHGDALLLPHWERPQFAGLADDYPFLLHPYRSIDYAEGGSRHLPVLRELPAATHGSGWEASLELNPGDAERLGIGEGDRVVVESPIARRQMTVHILWGMQAGVVGLNLGFGPWPPRASEPEASSGARGLVARLADPLAGVHAVEGTRVRIRKSNT